MTWTVFVLALIPALAHSGVVEVIVVDTVTKSPIAGAVVKLYRGDKAEHSGTSDVQGLFRIENVADGHYRAVVDHSDYMRVASDHPAARTFQIAGQKSEVRLRPELVPLGQIAGRVLSPTGEAMKGVPVGLRRLWSEQWAHTTTSVEGGLFRFPRLEPATWILAALPLHRITSSNPANDAEPVAPPVAEEEQKVGWAATFFPSVTDLAGAEKIVLRPGSVLEGYAIRLRTAPLRRLSGVVIDESGKPVPKAGIALTDLASKGSNGAKKITGNDGSFEFDSATDGDWRIFGQSAQSRPRLKGYAYVHVSRRDVTGIQVRLSAPFTVKGFVHREETRDTDGVRKVTAVHLIPQGASADTQDSTFHEQDGSFALSNVYPGRYRVLPVGYVPGYYVASIFYGHQDVTTQPIDIVNPPLPLKIVYQSGAARAAGTVERGEGAWVVLVPEDEALRDPDQFVRTTKCEADGRFAIDSLRPGSYYAFAFDRIDKQILGDLEFVRKLVPQAVRVNVRHGEAANLELRWRPWPDY